MIAPAPFFGLVMAGLLAAGAAAAQPTPSDVVAGRRLAEEYCGTCHAVGGGGSSPLPNAPPFRELFRRFPKDRLASVLREGMLAPSSPQEEGSPRRHPRMPTAPLGDDQRAELQAYLQSLWPATSPQRH